MFVRDKTYLLRCRCHSVDGIGNVVACYIVLVGGKYLVIFVTMLRSFYTMMAIMQYVKFFFSLLHFRFGFYAG